MPQYFLALQIFLLCLSYSLNMTVENQRKFYKFLEEDMCPYIKPKPDQRSPMVVNIDMALFSLLSYDDTTGTMSSLILMYLEWKDEFIENGNFSFEENDVIPIPLQLVWHPKILIVNTKTENTVLQTGESNYQTVLSSPNGIMKYRQIGLAITNCDANSFYYPNDEHQCELSFASDESIDEIAFNRTVMLPFEIKLTSKNVNWKVSELSIKETVDQRHSVKTMSFKISRRSLYIIINLVSPLVILCLLNLFVFYLPESSGERISFSLTMLLSFILYLNMITDRLPSTGPISLINICIVIQFTTSCLIVLMSIVTLCIQENNQLQKPVPMAWQVFARLTSLLKSTKDNCKSKVHASSVKKNKDQEDSLEETTKDCKTNTNWIDEGNATWREISQKTNRLFFFITLIMFLVQVIVYLILVF